MVRPVIVETFCVKFLPSNGTALPWNTVKYFIIENYLKKKIIKELIRDIDSILTTGASTGSSYGSNFIDLGYLGCGMKFTPNKKILMILMKTKYSKFRLEFNWNCQGFEACNCGNKQA